ncbi:HPr family phosphocarrier protein [candidate division KSB1 bacterium]|nr:HPr family phosphocarrier protein [candidate division KSB1 bacterium]
MIEKDFIIPNKLGLHARPAALLVKTLSRFDADIYITKDNQVVNGKSIMGVMTLAAEYGSTVRFRISGEDEEDVVGAVEEVFAIKFNED